MNSSRRLIANTIATYIRLILSVFVGLAIVRLLISEVGFESYGLFASMTAATALFGFLQTALVAGSVRHLAFEIGRANIAAAGNLFKAALVLFLTASLAVILVGILCSSFFFQVISVPAEKMDVANLIYWLSLFNLSVQLLSTPFRVALQARQSIVVLSIFDLTDKVARLISLALLFVFPFSPLISFMAWNLIISSILLVTFFVYCFSSFRECRLFEYEVRTENLKAIGKFSFWLVFESAATALREHGSIVMLSSFFGSIVAGSYDVATRLGNQIVSIASALSNVIAPAMAADEGKSDFRRVTELGDIMGRYCFFATSIFFVPILFEAGEVLRFWLGSVPPGAEYFLRLIVLIRMVGLLSWGDAMIARTKARISMLSLIMTIPYFVVFFLVFLNFRRGETDPMTLAWSMLAVSCLTGLVFRPWYVRRKILQQSYSIFVRDVCWPVFRVALPACLLTALVHMWMEAGLLRLLCVSGAYAFLSLGLYLVWGMSVSERGAWKKIIHSRTER